MLVAPCLDDLMETKLDIERLKQTRPQLFHQFMNVIYFTRQLHFKYQLMGALIMNEDPNQYLPKDQNEYVMSIYKTEINKLRTENAFRELQQLLWRNKDVSYGHISKLALGIHPSVLVGPTFIR